MENLAEVPSSSNENKSIDPSMSDSGVSVTSAKYQALEETILMQNNGELNFHKTNFYVLCKILIILIFNLFRLIQFLYSHLTGSNRINNIDMICLQVRKSDN